MNNKNIEYNNKNRERWDLLAEAHVNAAEAGTAGPFYDLAALKSGKSSLFPTELSELPDLKGKRILHLQCHFGVDTISLARMGKEVVGIDFSDNAIVAAVKLAKNLGVNATFVQSNIYQLMDVMVNEKESFDFVYTSHGVLCWLHDIKAWGKIISYFLKPGGQFYVIDSHPFVNIFDNEFETMDFKIVRPYFTKGRAFRYEGEGSYIDEDVVANPSIGNTVSYEWIHTLSDIIMSLINAGLHIEFLHEHPSAAWAAVSYTRQIENGEWVIDKGDLNIPLAFSILATKSCKID